MHRTPGLRLACPVQASRNTPHSTLLPFIIRSVRFLACDVLDFFRHAFPLATVLINHLEDDFSRLAFAGRMFRLIAVAPVVLPAFVRCTSSGRLSASLARALPFSEAKLVALAGQEAVSAAAPLANPAGEV